MKKVWVSLLLVLVLASCQSTTSDYEQDLPVSIQDDVQEAKRDLVVADKAPKPNSESVTLLEGQWAGIMADEEVVLRFLKNDGDDAVIEYAGEKYSVSEGGESMIDGLVVKALKTENDAVVRELGSEVSFWLGTEYGLYRDMLKEGDSGTYGPNDEYDIEVVFIGEGEDGLGEALFRVNGERTDALSEKDTEIFDGKSFLLVKDVYYRDQPTEKSLDRAELLIEVR